MRIAVVGTGYVGLVSAACFAELGHHVAGVDIDVAKVESLSQGRPTIFERGLEELLRSGLESGRLRFTTDLPGAIADAEIVFSAVATPPGEGYKADLRAVFSVAESVARHMDHSLVFVMKSTVPVGTGREIERRMRGILQERNKPNVELAVVSNPEFLREGRAMEDTMNPERIVVGVNGETWARERMDELYRAVTRVGRPILFMDRESAEVVKYACNAFLAMKISFINMLSELCEAAGADIRRVAAGMGLDSRIGPKFLHAGIGYGGSCFPKDVRALLATAKEYGLKFPLVEATDRVNAHQRERFIRKVLKTLPERATVAVWGLAFKPKTDDMRDAPSLEVIRTLIEQGHTVRAYDPEAAAKAKALVPPEVAFAESPLEAAAQADAVILLTEWDEFRGIDLAELQRTMRGNLLFDGRLVYEPEEARSVGLRYVGIGTQAATASAES